jgi:hypothetical protein
VARSPPMRRVDDTVALSATQPGCAICAGPGVGPRAELHLAHGVSVWLCAAHRSPAFLSAREGRALAERLREVWRSSCAFTARRARALDAHLARVQRAGRPRQRPGSFAWPRLREEAEARFARGERPAEVARALRAAVSEASATAPSVRTIHRWHAEGRWLAPPGIAPPRPGP